MSSKKVIVAAFEPFGRRKRNRARDAVELLRGEHVGHATVEVAELPVVFSKVAGAVRDLMARHPAVLILVGEAATATKLHVERLAVNVAHARIRDNAGARPIDEELVPGGEPARQVSFDPRPAVNAAIAAGCPSEVSNHAGTFCCNAALYYALGQAAKLPQRPRVAFVHVPARLPWARDHRAARGLLAIAQHLISSLS